MLTLEWSPIFAMLERGWQPLDLVREAGRWACASGIWEPRMVENVKPQQECETPEELVWFVLGKVAAKATLRGLLISLVVKIGWDYEEDGGRLMNLTPVKAEQADRVIWQRTPIPKQGGRHP